MTDRTHSRRTLIRAGLTGLAGTALAGCAGESGDSTATDSATESATASQTATEQSTESPESTPTETGSYSVTMAPVGTVEFDSVPESWLTYFPGYADMGVALGQSDGLTAVGNVGRYHTGYYDELDGVSLSKDDLTQLIGENGIDKELYLELDNDVHLTDPKWLTNVSFFGLESSDIADISESVGPFL
ncbi:MAG: Fe3+-hydroxamate ABC transporter substrate-binding protein, partial [Halobaculum sp.]